MYFTASHSALNDANIKYRLQDISPLPILVVTCRGGRTVVYVAERIMVDTRTTHTDLYKYIDIYTSKHSSVKQDVGLQKTVLI